jgi:hypothetical protein
MTAPPPAHRRPAPEQRAGGGTGGRDVQMDLVGPLVHGHVTGLFEASVESALLARPPLILTAARDLVLSNFPDIVAPDVPFNDDGKREDQARSARLLVLGR